jgi:hypothetical protein
VYVEWPGFSTGAAGAPDAQAGPPSAQQQQRRHDLGTNGGVAGVSTEVRVASGGSDQDAAGGAEEEGSAACPAVVIQIK